MSTTSALPGTLWAAFVRSPEAHAKIVERLLAGARARRDPRRVHRRGHGGPRRPAARWPGYRPASRFQNPEHWPVARRHRRPRRRSGRHRHRRGPLRRDRRGRGRDRRVRAAPRSSSTRRRQRSRALRSCTTRSAPNKVHERSLPAATLRTPGSRRPTSSSSVGSSTTGPPARRSSRAACSPTTGPAALTLHSSTQVPHFVRLFLAILLGMGEERCGRSRPKSAAASARRSHLRRGSAWPAASRSGSAFRSSGSRTARRAFVATTMGRDILAT